MKTVDESSKQQGPRQTTFFKTVANKNGSYMFDVRCFDLAVRRGHRRLRGKGRKIAMWGMILSVSTYVSNTHGTQAQREQSVPLATKARRPKHTSWELAWVRT